ncbi:alpha/beta hydrolase fold domain-containing protein [Streptomyces sp. SID8354]|nr:alpha/beta hydrolase fold domain-containing protein [Streptomyces sp. SID8354]
MLPAVDVLDPAAARETIAKAMALVARRWPRTADGVVIREEHVPGPPGAPPVRVSVYRPAEVPDGGLPAVLLLHGGGFVVGSLEAEHYKALLLARDAGCLAVSVDYRLAPEHPFPAALRDCAAVLAWLAGRGGEPDVDPARIAVAGTSSGAGLAAGLAQRVRDRGGPALAYQQLVFPVVDDVPDRPSVRRYGARSTAAMWRQYLGPAHGAPPLYAVPNRTADLTGLPPAYLLTAQVDAFRDGGLDYGRRLVEAGNAVEIHHFPGSFHGFDTTVPRAAVSKRALSEQIQALRTALHR